MASLRPTITPAKVVIFKDKVQVILRATSRSIFRTSWLVLHKMLSSQGFHRFPPQNKNIWRVGTWKLPPPKYIFLGKPMFALTSQQLVKNHTWCPEETSWGRPQGCLLSNKIYEHDRILENPSTLSSALSRVENLKNKISAQPTLIEYRCRV